MIYAVVPYSRRIQESVAAACGRAAFTWVVFAVLAVCAIWAVTWCARRRAAISPRSIVALLAVFAAYGARAWTLDDSPEEALHLVEYGLLSLLLFRALAHRVRDPSIYPSAVILATLIGIGDEFLQWVTPRRFWGFGDIGLNAFAAALMQAGIAWGIRPSWIARPVPPRPALGLARRAAVLALVLLAATSNTPPRMAWLRAHVPFEGLRAIDDIMIEYGHCFTHPDAGPIKSRLREEELRAYDAAHAVEVAAELDRYLGHKGYALFFQDHYAYEEPFLYEARVRLFRRDFHLRAALKNRHDMEKLRMHATIVYREQQILDAYFSNTVARSAYRIDPAIVGAVDLLADKDKPYVTPVSESLICSFTERQLRYALLSALLAALAACAYYRTLCRRME